jgi:DNA gyrase inhibitor GyrI
MGGMSVLAQLQILDWKRKTSKETSVQIWDFLEKNFRYRDGFVGVKRFVKNKKEVEVNFVTGGLLYAVIEEFPETKTNVLIPTQAIIKKWVESKMK